MHSPVIYLFLLGMLVSLQLLFFNGFRGINLYLAAFIFLSTLHAFLNYLFLLSDNIDLLAFLTGSIWSLYYLIGPMALFYFRGMLLDRAALKKWDYLHFLPFAIIFSGSLPYTLFSSFEEKIEVAKIIVGGNWEEYQEVGINKLVTTYLNEFLRGLQGLVYAFWCVYLLVKYRSRLSQVLDYNAHRTVIRNWLVIFAALYCSFVITRIIISIAIIMDFEKSAILQFTNPIRTIFAFCFLGFLVILLFFPRILYGLPIQAEKSQQAGADLSTISNETGNGQKDAIKDDLNPADDFFSESYTRNIELQLKKWVEEKNYLTKDISLSILSISTGIPRHHLSYYFNYVLKEPFIEWRNRIRITHACELMKTNFGQQMTLDGISSSCGFSAYSTFHRVFKQIIGVTPSEYIADLGK
jgi:AraC-like DNA-binding protein